MGMLSSFVGCVLAAHYIGLYTLSLFEWSLVIGYFVVWIVLLLISAILSSD